MNKIYLDNAATSFPKPIEVADAVYKYMTEIGTNINRGGYEDAYGLADIVYETREMLASMFGAGDCKNVVFTKNVTESLNIVLKGFLGSGDHVLCSSMEHNAVMRPLTQLQKSGLDFDRIPCDERGALRLDDIPAMIKHNTKAVIINHASNLVGTINPIAEAAEIAHEHGLKVIVDAAQSAGIFPIDMESMQIDALCFTGHKSLLGPQGTGGFVLSEEMAELTYPILSGGTGSISHTEEVPSFMPDKFEPGTLNLPGLVGLNAALKWINREGMYEIRSHELALTERFLQGAASLEDAGMIRIIGPKDTRDRAPVVSIQSIGSDLADVAFRLDSEYGIAARVGLHCTPSSHKAMGTFPEGTLRFSFGVFNTESEIDSAISALTEICR